jgi:hypothetical protein
MFISDPGYGFLTIPDPGSQILDPKTTTTTKSRGKKLAVLTFFVAVNLNFKKSK